MLKEKLMIDTSIFIDANREKVWKALVTPSLIKKYLMDTNVTSDWKEGSSIIYEGEFQGKKYKDKGVIRKIDPPKLLQSTYWSSMRGNEDKPENYNLLTFRLFPFGEKTKLEVTQDHVESEKEKEQMTNNWNSVLEKLKELVEKIPSES
jgi:uncharacterized protein YndB with AHSA1/START domain